MSERLHPDGAPGIYDGLGRTLLGDSGYDRISERSEIEFDTNNGYSKAEISVINAKAIFVMFAGLTISTTQSCPFRSRSSSGRSNE